MPLTVPDSIREHAAKVGSDRHQLVKKLKEDLPCHPDFSHSLSAL